jgi:pimeloyl-ACP methyl ester carboxylesterase
MSNVTTSKIASFDGVKLAVHEMGEGRPLLLLHGLFSSAEVNWIKFGHAKRLAEAGFRCIMPDLRVHGQSDAPHDPAAYPPDVLVQDAFALIEHFALDSFDVAGFSLGARTLAMLLVQGLSPDHAVFVGMGWEGLSGWNSRRDFFVDVIDRRETIKRGDAAFMALSFMKTMKIDPVAARLLLHSFCDVDTDRLVACDVPALVICGKDDQDNGSASLLAENLADAQFREIPGTHMSSVVEPALSKEMASFLTS